MTEVTTTVQVKRTARFNGRYCDVTCEHRELVGTKYRCNLFEEKLYTRDKTSVRCSWCKYHFTEPKS